VEAGWGVVLVLFLAGAMVSRSAASRRRAALPAIRTAALDALIVYLGGNRDLSRLKAIAAVDRQELEKTILDLQFLVRREELCGLAIQLDYVQDWCSAARSPKVEVRREAFAHLAAMAHYGPVRRIMGNLPGRGFADPDEKTRLEAARILLSGEDPDEIAMVFERVLADTPRIRLLTAQETGRHAAELCRSVAPKALQSREPGSLVNLLRILASWERGLPLPNVAAPASHPDPGVRAEVMRLLPWLPSTPENVCALRSGLADENPSVRDAAARAAGRLGLSNAVPPAVAIHMACAGGGDAC